MIRMHADRRHLGEIARVHSLAGHGDQLATNADAEEGAELVRPRRERPGLGQLGQRHHGGDVSRA